MNGIDILNKEEILTTPEWIGLVLTISTIIFIVSIIFAFVFLFTSLDTASFFFIIMFVCSSIVCVISNYLNDTYNCEPTGRYRYEATIDDSVSITEVYDHYNIVEQRGDIWILEDKED